MSVVACSADSRASEQRLGRARRAARRAPVHVEIASDLASFLGEQHREQKAGSQHLAEIREKPRPRAGPERPGVAAVFAQQRRPDLDVPVLDLGEPAIQVALLRVLLGVGQQPIQIRRVGLVLPVMVEGVEVDGAGRGGVLS